MPRDYEFIEHTADIGVRVKAKDLSGLFASTAAAMFDIMAEKSPVTSHQSPVFEISLKSDNLEELFINWLNELLSLSSAKELILSGFQIKKISANNLEAGVSGSDIKDYRVNTEIKAATYHQLKIEKLKSGWQAEVIFDV